jgi:hypothetical protein
MFIKSIKGNWKILFGVKCGIDKRTIQNWIRALTTFGFINEINPNIYKINLNINPELLELAIKEGQKKLM